MDWKKNKAKWVAAMLLTPGMLAGQPPVLPNVSAQLAPAEKTIRLALIAETEDVSIAADILTVELSSNQNFQLLERGEIAKVYREQGLSAQNKDYIKLGQLVGADGLLLLKTSQSGTNQYITTRLVAVKPGVAIGETRSPAQVGKDASWARWVEHEFEPLFPKLTVLTGNAIPISIVNLRSTLRTLESQSSEDELKVLLVHRLTQERQLFVLERQHLSELVFEKELAPENDSPFWTGRYLLDGTVDKDGYNAARMTIDARLTSPNGGPVIQLAVAGSRSNPSELVESLTAKIMAALKQAPNPTEWRPLEEAKQYHEEAKWAYRWGLMPEAQAACESALALGLRTRELAELRVVAYTEDAWMIDDGTGGMEIPGFPQAAQIKPMTRALELFEQDVPILFTNSSPLDLEWFFIGTRVFTSSAAILDGFYQAAELREGNETQLSELRSLTREMLTILEARKPTDQLANQTFFNQQLGGSPPYRNFFLSDRLKRYERIKWVKVGLIQEKPEEALPFFWQMVAQGYGAEDLPRITAWNWDDRKRIPQVTKDFINRLSASTNAVLRLKGLYFAALDTPVEWNGSYASREKELFSAVWDLRAQILTNAADTQFMRAMQAGLGKKHGYDSTYDYNEWQDFSVLLHRLRMEFLTQTTNFDEATFLGLFPNSSQRYETADQARESLAAIEIYKDRIPPSHATNAYLKMAIRKLSSFSGTKSPPSILDKPVTPKLQIPRGDPMTVSFVPWNLQRPGIDPDRKTLIYSPRFRNGRLWFLVRYTGKFYATFDSQANYVALDTRTGRTEEIPFSEKMGHPDGNFEVTKDSLFVSVHDHLQRYRFAEKTWESIPVPLTRGAQITEFQGQLILATDEGVLELDPESHAVQILVSTRRQPPLNLVDPLWDKRDDFFWRSHYHFWPRPDGALDVVLSARQAKFFRFTPGSTGWEQLPPFPKFPDPAFDQFFSSEGAQLLVVGINSPARLMAYWLNPPGPELLLEQHVRPDMEYPRPALIKELGRPRWDWPEGYTLEDACALVQSNRLWVLQPRTLYEPGRPPEEAAVYQDDRQATILHFEPEIRQAMFVPLRIEKDGQPADPFDPKKLDDRFLQNANPFWLAVPQGLLMICPKLAGHWLIPWENLNSRLHDQLASLRKPANEEAIDSHSSPEKSDDVNATNTESMPPAPTKL